ncbi:MAG: response regulator [Flavobacteriales bacterium]|nr:response regulator [Flavobacteriales bacterium]
MEEDFDVVLMDAHMPILDGIEATKRIREAGRNIPIIALTASVLNEKIHKCLEAGMNDALPKPFKREDLLKVLERFYTKA